MTRRDFIKLLATFAAGLFLPWIPSQKVNPTIVPPGDLGKWMLSDRKIVVSKEMEGFVNGGGFLIPPEYVRSILEQAGHYE